LPGTVVECHELIRQLQVNHVQVMQRLSELEERLKLNSRNSSKPPSSDGPGTPPRAPRPKSGKRLGGQPGHPGSFRAMVPVEQTQVQVACPPPEHCERCGADVHGDPDKPIRHQVFELPQIEPLITEYVRLRGVCSGCGLKHHGALPVGVPTDQLGPRALALVGTLAGQLHLTQRKVQAVLSHMGEQPSFVTVSDRYAGYNYLALEQRQVCWAHLLRDFERIAGRSALAGQIGKRLLAYGFLLFRWRGQDKGAQHFGWLQKRIRVQLELATAQTQCSRTANTCANLIKMWSALWTFVHNPLVPPTNKCGRTSAARLGDQAKALLLHAIRSGNAFLGNHHVHRADLHHAGQVHF